MLNRIRQQFEEQIDRGNEQAAILQGLKDAIDDLFDSLTELNSRKPPLIDPRILSLDSEKLTGIISDEMSCKFVQLTNSELFPSK